LNIVLMIAAKPPIAIVGAGYVGLITAAGFIAQGHEVWIAEKDQAKRRDLQAHRFPINEPGLPETVAEHGRRLHVVERVEEALEESGAHLLFVAVGTPPLPSGEADLTHVHEVVDAIPSDSDVTVVMKSTVPPGTGRTIVAKARREGKRLSYASCPEFLQEGRALEDVREPSRIVIGADDDVARTLLEDLHGPFTDALRKPAPVPLIATDITTAETIKHSANFHLALRISFANQIANVCEELGADVRTVMDGIGLDKRIGRQFLDPGLGFGGSCLTKDVQALRAVAHRTGQRLTLADTLLDVNEDQPERAVRKLFRHLGSLEGRTIALLGLAFKPQTDDIRCGSAFALAHRLRHHQAIVRAFDPDPDACRRAVAQAERKGVVADWIEPSELAEDALDAVRGADACVLVTEWDCFVGLDWTEIAAAMSGTLIVDGRNALDADRVRMAGLTYEGTGRESAGLWRAAVAPTLAR
jgi:UDPglucose 6-dehydrogenase